VLHFTVQTSYSSLTPLDVLLTVTMTHSATGSGQDIIDTTHPHYGGKVKSGGSANPGIIAEQGELETFCRYVVAIELMSQREGRATLGSVVNHTYTDGKDNDLIHWLTNQLAHNLLLLDYVTSLARENCLTIVQLLGYTTPKY